MQRPHNASLSHGSQPTGEIGAKADVAKNKAPADDLPFKINGSGFHVLPLITCHSLSGAWKPYGSWEFKHSGNCPECGACAGMSRGPRECAVHVNDSLGRKRGWGLAGQRIKSGIRDPSEAVVITPIYLTVSLCRQSRGDPQRVVPRAVRSREQVA